MQIRENLHWVGVLNPGLRCFDFIPTRFGTTYNSYLILGPQPTLVDGVFRKYRGLYLDKIRALVPPEKLAYYVINHTEHDHSSGVGAVLDVAPQITVVGTQTAIDFLKKILNRDFQSRAVEDHDRLDIGGRHLQFLRVPFWHWPDTMFSYLEEDKVLFTCDGFGAHFCDERMFDDQVDNFAGEFREYYNHIMRAFAPKIRDGLACIKDLPIDVIAPSHGPILRTDPHSYIRLYEQWSVPAVGPRKRIVIFYASIYRSTVRIAEAIAAGADETCDVRMVDAYELEPEIARDEIEKSEGLLFGSVTLNADAAVCMWELLALLKSVSLVGKKAAAFGSYGWSGEAVGLIEERLKGLRVPVVKSDLRIQFTPTPEDLNRARAFGREFAKQL